MNPNCFNTNKARRQRLIAERGQRLCAELQQWAAACRERLDAIDREFPEPPDLIEAPIPAPATQHQRRSGPDWADPLSRGELWIT